MKPFTPFKTRGTSLENAPKIHSDLQRTVVTHISIQGKLYLITRQTSMNLCTR